MIFIVDGTGDWFNDTYAKEMANSFCNQLATEAGSKAMYRRGPSLTGVEVSGTAKEIAAEIESRPAFEKIYLCGYSRGGLTVIDVAARIRPRIVEAMFLFDAVDRAAGPDGGEISGNVRNVYFARRNPDFARSFETEVKSTRANLVAANKTVTDSRNRVVAAFLGSDPKAEVTARSAVNSHAIARNQDSDLKWNTRNVEGLSFSNFGNTGLTVQAPGRHAMATFDGSHGALGGVPWSDEDVPGDAKCVPVVRAWMWANFIKEGVFLGHIYLPAESTMERARRTA